MSPRPWLLSPAMFLYPVPPRRKVEGADEPKDETDDGPNYGARGTAERHPER